MIKYLDWDSNFFGVKTGRITNISEVIELESFLKQAVKEKFKLIYFFASPDNQLIQQAAINNNGLIVDIKVTYSINLTSSISKTISDNNKITTYPEIFPNNELINIALQTGKYSRFKKDKNFRDGSFEELYKQWIIQSTNKNIAENVLVYTDEDIIKGMVTVSQNSGVGKIGLIGVDQYSQGERIGTKLIEYVKSYFFNKGILKIEVVTQQENVNACKFYEKAGFSVLKSESIYHFWL